MKLNLKTLLKGKWGLWMACVAIASPVHATLGEMVEVSREGKQLASARPAIRQATTASASGTTSYVRYAITLPDGGTAHEFVNAQGRVFAIRWQSPSMPDLQALLGRYKSEVDQMQSAQRQSGVRQARRLESVTSTGLSVAVHGHLRAFYGQALLKSLAPVDFDVRELEQ